MPSFLTADQRQKLMEALATMASRSGGIRVMAPISPE